MAGDGRDPDSVLDEAAKTLDLSQPVPILLIAVLHLLADDEDPHGIVARLVDRVAPGSYLAISHLTADIAPAAMTALAERLNARARETFVMRDLASVFRFFDGLDPIEPGVVQVDQWRPGYLRPRPADGQWVPSFYGGVARTPARPPGLPLARQGLDPALKGGNARDRPAPAGEPSPAPRGYRRHPPGRRGLLLPGPGRLLARPYFDGVEVARLERHQVQFLAFMLGGPTYPGRPLAEAHRGLGITSDHYDRVVAHLRDALAGADVDDDIVAAITDALAHAKPDIVESTTGG